MSKRKQQTREVDYWILDKFNEPIEATLDEWSEMWRVNQGQNRVIARHQIKDVTVSTVFIGLAGDFFETMIFGGPHDMWQFKTDGYDIALVAHTKGCELAFGPHWVALIKIAEIRGEHE